MKRILYAWELGGGLGHVSRFLPLARVLQERGCDITWALTDLAPARALLKDKPAELLQAPRFEGQVTGLLEPQLSFSEMLMRCGYLRAETLTPLLRDWRALIEAAKLDLVITDHAPTGLLAARSLGLPVARIGTGFCCPPARDPEAPFMPWLAPSTERSDESVRTVLASINGALQSAGAAPLTSLARMHAVDEDIVTTYAELDHYPQRPTPRWGVLLGSEGGVVPEWPAVRGTRVFAYLRPHQPQTVPLLRALRRKHCVCLIYCPGLAPEVRSSFESPAMRFSNVPLDIEAATSACDLVVCGAGHGTVCAALLAGKPLLLAPEVVEQGITTHHVETMGAGLGLVRGLEGRAGTVLARLLFEPGFARAAQGFRARHDGISQAQIINGIADRCMELLVAPRTHGVP